MSKPSTKPRLRCTSVDFLEIEFPRTITPRLDLCRRLHDQTLARHQARCTFLRRHQPRPRRATRRCLRHPRPLPRWHERSQVNRTSPPTPLHPRRAHNSFVRSSAELKPLLRHSNGEISNSHGKCKGCPVGNVKEYTDPYQLARTSITVLKLKLDKSK